MNVKQFLLAISFAATGGSTLAQQAEFVAPDAGFVSVKTRAEVMAEVRQARADGSLVTNDAYPISPTVSASGLTRKQVRDEFMRSASRPGVAHGSDARNLNNPYFGG